MSVLVSTTRVCNDNIRNNGSTTNSGDCMNTSTVVLDINGVDSSYCIRLSLVKFDRGCVNSRYKVICICREANDRSTVFGVILNSVTNIQFVEGRESNRIITDVNSLCSELRVECE